MVKMEKKIIKREIDDININLIDISEENVRKVNQKSNIDELKTSIQRVGLVHPVILIEKKGGRYDLLAGQRRLIAFEQLNQKKIPSIIINNLDSLSKKILSFTENIHRRDLPYEDTIRICDELFNYYKGTKDVKIERIAKDIGISPETVAKYLAYRLVPKNVRIMVQDGKISRSAAYKITTAFWPNSDKIEKIAIYASEVPNATWSHALDLGKENPTTSINKIIEESSKVPQEIQFTVKFGKDTYKILETEAKERSKLEKREISIKEFILQIIEEYIGRKG